MSMAGENSCSTFHLYIHKTQTNCFLLLNLLFPIRQALDLPDGLSLLEEAERAPDPLFGVMYMQDATLSPSTLMKVRMHKCNTAGCPLYICSDKSVLCLFCLSQWDEKYLGETSPDYPEPISSAAAELESGRIFSCSVMTSL